MAERHNTVVCTFDPTSPPIKAFDIHKWIHDAPRIPEHTVHMIQIDGIKRQVYIKWIDKDSVLALLRSTNGLGEYKHHTGQLSIVSTAVVGKGTKRVRIANLPPEVPDDALRAALALFGTAMAIQEEMLSKTSRYAVANGIRHVTIKLYQHIPSHLTVAGHRVLLSYEGQPSTCCGCGDIGHLYPTCPKLQKRETMTRDKQQITYASIAAPSASPPATQLENTTNELNHNNMEKHTDPMTPRMDMKRQATDLCMPETDPPPPADPETPQIPIDARSEAVNEQQLHNQTGEGIAATAKDMWQKE